MNTLLQDPLIDFVQEYHKHWANKSQSELATYLRWHQARDLLATSFVGDEPFALCAVRFFGRLEDWLIPWVFEPDGAFGMVDLLVSVSPLSEADCFQQLVKRWGARPVMIWERGDRTIESTKAPRMFRWDQFVKLTRRMTYGAIGD